jgi:hypothetical protein
MKKTFSFNLVLITLFTGLFVSCTKEKINNPESTVNNATTLRFAPDEKYGGITGTVNPAGVKAFIMLHGSNNTFGPYSLYSDGSFKIGNLPAGTYKFVLHWADTRSGNSDTGVSYSTITIEVAIEPGTITDMKTIYLK